MTGLRVLFVDDEQELVATILERLRLRGVDATGVTEAKEAVELIRRERFDIVVLDVKMPGLGGLELLRIIKKEKPSLPVIFLTGYGSEKEAEEGCRAGARDYLMKPIDLDRLLELMRTATSDAPAESENGAPEDPGALAFFARIVADFDHDVTNVLNTINELVGLQKDMIGQHPGASPAAGERLGVLVDRVANQVRRGVEIVRRMSRFAHSVEGAEASLDLGEAVDGLVALAARRVRLAGARVEAAHPAEAVTVRASPFVLYEALYRGVEACLEAAPKLTTITVGYERQRDGILLFVRSEGESGPRPPLRPREDRLRLLADRLHGSIVALPGEGHANRIELLLPAGEPPR
ncbi:MAG: response regulator [Planctomycetota bacterium]